MTYLRAEESIFVLSTNWPNLSSLILVWSFRVLTLTLTHTRSLWIWNFIYPPTHRHIPRALIRFCLLPSLLAIEASFCGAVSRPGDISLNLIFFISPAFFRAQLSVCTPCAFPALFHSSLANPFVFFSHTLLNSPCLRVLMFGKERTFLCFSANLSSVLSLALSLAIGSRVSDRCSMCMCVCLCAHVYGRVNFPFSIFSAIHTFFRVLFVPQESPLGSIRLFLYFYPALSSSRALLFSKVTLFLFLSPSISLTLCDHHYIVCCFAAVLLVQNWIQICWICYCC